MITATLSMPNSLRCSSIASTYLFGASNSCTPRHRAAQLRPISALNAPEKIKKIGSKISSLTLKESRILADYLHVEFGVSIHLSATSAAAAVFSPMDGDGVGATATVEEQTKFDVVINEVDASHRIKVVKAIRALTCFPFAEVRPFIDGVPKTFMEGVTKDKAEEAKRQLEEAGAAVSIV